MSQPYLATIDDGRCLVRAKDGTVTDKGDDWTLDGLDPQAFDLDAISKDLAGELHRVQREADTEEDTAPASDDIADVARAEESAVQEGLTKWRQTCGGYDLLTATIGSKPPWVPGADEIIKLGERQSWVAKEGEGKTQAAVHLAVQVVQAGGIVVYIDVENDKEEMAERFQPIFTAWEAHDAWAQRGTYLPDLNLGAVMSNDALLADWVKAIYPADLLIIDSWSRVLSQFGYSEDSNEDIIKFMREAIDPFVKHKIAILILDNTGHEGTRSRGAISKSATVEAVYAVTGGTKMGPTKHGTLTLKRKRCRSGKLAEIVTAGSGGGEFTPLAPAEGSAEGEDAKVVNRRLLIKSFLWDRRDKKFTADAIAAAVKEHPKSVARTLGELKKEGFVTCAKQGNTNHWAAVSQ